MRIFFFFFFFLFFFLIIILLNPPTLWIEGTPCITQCVMAELEKLGQKYRVALRYLPMLFTHSAIFPNKVLCLSST